MTILLNLRDSKHQEPARDKRLLIYSGSPLPPRPLPFPSAAKDRCSCSYRRRSPCLDRPTGRYRTSRHSKNHREPNAKLIFFKDQFHKERTKFQSFCRPPSFYPFIFNASMKRRITSGLPVCLPSSSLNLQVSL